MAIKAKRLILMIVGVIFAPLSLFFTYYTVRLIYLNLTMEDAAAHRNGGMLIGAIAFPLAAIIFGLISWFSFRYFLAGYRKK